MNFTIFLIFNVYVMFYYKIEWFYQNFKSVNMFFESILDNTGPVPGDV